MSGKYDELMGSQPFGCEFCNAYPCVCDAYDEEEIDGPSLGSSLGNDDEEPKPIPGHPIEEAPPFTQAPMRTLSGKRPRITTMDLMCDEDLPDLPSYFGNYPEMATKDVIACCRGYAAYLAAQGRARRVNKHLDKTLGKKVKTVLF